MAWITHNVKKIEGAAHKNGDVDGTCKRAFTQIDTGTGANGVCNMCNITQFSLPGATLLLLFIMNNSLFTLPDTDSSNASDSDSKPDG